MPLHVCELCVWMGVLEDGGCILNNCLALVFCLWQGNEKLTQLFSDSTPPAPDPYKDVHTKCGMREWCITVACRHAHVRMHIYMHAHSNPVNPWLILFVWRTQSCSYTTTPRQMESCCTSKKLGENGGKCSRLLRGKDEKRAGSPKENKVYQINSGLWIFRESLTFTSCDLGRICRSRVELACVTMWLIATYSVVIQRIKLCFDTRGQCRRITSQLLNGKWGSTVPCRKTLGIFSIPTHSDRNLTGIIINCKTASPWVRCHTQPSVFRSFFFFFLARGGWRS